MKTVTWAGLRTRVLGGEDGNGAGEGPVVVLLHGYGAPGDDLVGLHQHLPVPANTRFVFPHAPLSLFEGAEFGMGDARAWWPIDVVELELAMRTGRIRDFRSEHPPELPSARASIRELLNTIRTTMKPSLLALGGFSQGAMLSLDVALHEEESLSALLLFSGAYLSEDVWKPRFSQLKNVPIAQSHGTEDPILPFVQAEALAKDLTLAGASVTFTAFRGPHTIPAGALLRAGEVLKAAVDAIAT